MKIEVEQVDTCVRRLSVEIPIDRVNHEFNACYTQLQRRIKLPGFRPGKVPRQVLENYYRPSIEQEVLQKLLPDALSEALVQEGLHPVAQPHIDQIDLTKDEPLRFVATAYIIPDFRVSDYHDWQFERRIPAVMPAHVEEALQLQRQRHAELHAITDRPVATGDYVLIDSRGFLEGQLLPGMEGRNLSVEVGAGQFVAEIEEGLVGMEAGSEKTIFIPFPETHHDATVAGKHVEFRVTVVEIKEKVLPELDDEFARAYEEADSLDEVRQRLHGELEEAARRRADDVLWHDMLTRLVAENPIAVPEVLVDEQIRQLHLQQVRQEMGRELREEETQVDLESLRPTYGEQALAAVRGQVLIHRMEEDMGVSVLPEEVDAEIRGLATRAAQNPEALRQVMERNGSLRAFEAGIRERKVFQTMMAAVHITDVHVDASASQT